MAGLARSVSSSCDRTHDELNDEMRVRKQLTEADWDAVPSSAKIRRRVDLSNLGRRPSVDKRQKTVSMLVAGLLVHPVREPADEHPLTHWRAEAVCLLRKL